MDNILKFSVDNIELLDKIEDSLFRKVRIKAFATGPNSHTLPVEEDVLRRAAKSIYNKPILWRYNKFLDDAMGHEKDEVPCGFVPEKEDNPVQFVEQNDKIYIVINALLWTKYSGRLIDIFERDGNKKDVSVEMAVIEDEENMSDKPRIKDFVISGITILGEMVNPACKGCDMELLEFSEDKNTYLKQIEYADSIKINNSKDASVNGQWSNPRRKLFNPISKASNRESLLKEAYLIGDSSSLEITKFKYPHHVIRDGQLVIHQRGLEAAFQRASQQGIVRGDVRSHLLRHYKELGLTTENFSEFNLSEEEFNLYFSEEFEEKSGGELEMNENEKMAQDTEEEKKENMAEDEKKPAEEDMSTSEEKKVGIDEFAEDDKSKDKDDDDKDDDDDDKSEDDSKDENMSSDEFKCRMSEMAEKISKLEECNKAYMSQIESMSDYAELKKFKEDTICEMAKQEQMAKMEKVMSEIRSKGIDMSEEDKAELMSKIKEFSSVDAWANSVKAHFFDKAENIDGVMRIGLPFKEENTAQFSDNDIWAGLIK